jgi:uncharacterized membrane protein
LVPGFAGLIAGLIIYFEKNSGQIQTAIYLDLSMGYMWVVIWLLERTLGYRAFVWPVWRFQLGNLFANEKAGSSRQ